MGASVGARSRPAAKRGKAPTLTGARAALRERVEKDRENEFEASLLKRVYRKEKVVGGHMEETPIELDDIENRGAEELRVASEANLNLILGLTGKSVNLKGGYAAKIRRAAGAIRDMLESLVGRNVTDEVRRLKADICRLTRELELSREEVRAYRREFEDSRKKVAESTSAKEPADLMQDIAVMVGNIVDDRMAALQLPAAPPCGTPMARDSRPLARATRATSANKNRMTAASSASVGAQLDSEEPPTLPLASSKGKGKGKDKGKGKVKEVEWTAFGPSTSKQAATQRKEGEVAIPHEEPRASWTEVVRRKSAANKRTASAPPAKNPVTKKTAASTPPAKKETPKPRLALPRSAAVIIKLRPEAVARGATYGSTLLKAESNIDLNELGIGPLRIRQSATGARLIEVTGSTCGDKADALAARLKEALAEEVEVLRPEKRAEMRISGLSDAVTAERLATAVAKEGGCSPGQVHVRNIRVGQMGSGTAHIEVPAAAGKKLLQAGKIAVGWSRGVVHLLQARPRHCFRCLGLGHVGATCPAGTDRSALCYRCGQAGHKAAGCSAAARCAVCADAGRPAGHVMGGMACKPPITRGKFPSQTSQGGNQVVTADAEMAE
ncbi:uncharacterized protein LOC123656621 [Melitaea cinxia]|uniref:uncharacterized protein LOC123656621 n=1 Tax=Melitaea cinxia TaxID=113334 RepID=UPI001E26EECD|nr:uncharacterized protein LOC123656621 [Melitaea cinxia]